MHGKAAWKPQDGGEGGRVGEYAPNGTEGLQGGSTAVDATCLTRCAVTNLPAVSCV